MGCYINYNVLFKKGSRKKQKSQKWQLKKIKNALTISLSSKVGTGAIIGVLAAMWKASDGGIGGEGMVLWICVGMLILVPLTYSEVVLTQITGTTPRGFIEKYLHKGMGKFYTMGLILLYSFGFVGFQFMGIQNVVKIFSGEIIGHNMDKMQVFKFVLIPILILVALIVITKNYGIFIKALGSMITFVIGVYFIFFIVFVIKTHYFIPEYLGGIIKDFLSFRSAALGIPIGLVIGFQRIIQISETGLGTSALASSDRENTPEREALIQSISTVLAIFIAVVITSYVFTFGRSYIDGILLTGNGGERLGAYFKSAMSVMGYFGGVVLLVFFIVSGMTTILGSFHFINMTLETDMNKKIIFYIGLITLSAGMSVSNFDVIFDISDLLMFIVASINILAIFNFTRKKRGKMGGINYE